MVCGGDVMVLKTGASAMSAVSKCLCVAFIFCFFFTQFKEESKVGPLSVATGSVSL